MLLARKLQITLITLSSWTFLTWKTAEKQNANGVNWQQAVLKFGKKARLHWSKQFLQKYRLTDHSLCATHLPGPVIINCMVTPNLVPRKKKQAHVVICIFSKNAIFSNVATTFASVLLTKLRFFNHGRRKDFFQGGSRGFPQIIFQGGQKWWNLFFTPRNWKNNLFCS